MSKKIITNELITSKLEEQGYLEYHDMEQTEAWNLLQAHYNCEVDDGWRNKHYDFHCYTETTADGYEVYVTTNDPDNICVSEDVHYYDNDLSDEIEQAIYDGNSMYIDDVDSPSFKLAVENAYETMYNDKKQEIENELIEQGYEYENADEAIA